MLIVLACMRCISKTDQERKKKAVNVYYPPERIETHGVNSPFWDHDMFRAHFRFKKEEFIRIMDAMNLTGKSILCGRKGRAQYFPADIMILLRSLAFLSRFVDLVLIFGIPSNRVCEIIIQRWISCILSVPKSSINSRFGQSIFLCLQQQ